MKKLALACILVMSGIVVYSGDFDWLITQIDGRYDQYEPSVIAWSKKGHALVVQGMNTEFRGGIGFELKIIDFVTDKMVVALDFHSDDVPNPERDKPSILMTATNSGKAFLKTIKDLAIVQSTASQAVLAHFPYVDKSVSIELRIDELTRTQNDDGIDAISAQVKATNKGKVKTLGQTTKVMGEKIIVLGYFKNPFENRIACLVLTVGPTFEASPSLYYEFFGCKTDSGFQ